MAEKSKDLVFIGAGGYFLEIFDYITEDLERKENMGIMLKGVLDEHFESPPRLIDYLGKPSDYQPSKNDLFLISLGSPAERDHWYKVLVAKGAQFYTYVHPTAIISRSATIGAGVIVAPYVIVNSEAIVEDNVSLNVHASVGHEAKVGRSTGLSPFSAINGRASTGSRCFLGTRATIFPGVSIGDQTIVDTHSYVKKSVGSRKIVSQRGPYECLDNRMLRS